MKAKVAKRSADNPEKKSLANKKWYEKNKEHKAIKDSEWRKANREKCRTYLQNYKAKQLNAEGIITPQLIQEKLEYYNYCCMYCGEPLNGEYDIEHIIPLSRGGTNSPENIGVACRHCNRSKGAKTVEEWRE